MTIRWKRIQKTTSELFPDQPINIHVTTALNNLIEFLSVEKGGVDILINAIKCKGENQVIIAISHALAHLKTNVALHDQIWETAFKELLDAYALKLGIHDLEITLKEMEPI